MAKKLKTLCLHSNDGSNARLIKVSTNKLWRIEINSLMQNVDHHRSFGGYFLEYGTKDLTEIIEIVNRRYQTLSYFGFPLGKLKELISKRFPLGIDRVVPIGRTTDFDLIWDGHDLIRTLSRECVFI